MVTFSVVLIGPGYYGDLYVISLVRDGQQIGSVEGIVDGNHFNPMYEDGDVNREDIIQINEQKPWR